MQDLGLKTFNKLYPMMIKKYQDLIVDQNATEKDKINQIIQKLNALGKLSNDVVRDWNTVYQWAMNDGLVTDVNNKIEAMNASGELATLLHDIFISLTGDMSTLHTTAKDTTVNAINEVNDLAKQNQTDIATNAANIESNALSLAEIALQISNFSNYVSNGDWTPAFQAAQNSLPSNGGTIFVNQDVTIKTPLVFTKKVKLVGTGYSTLNDPTFRPKSSILKDGNFIGITLSGQGCIAQDLHIEGLLGNGGDGIKVLAGRATLQNVSSHNHGGCGIRIGGENSENVNDWRAINIYTIGNGLDGFMVQDTQQPSMPNTNAGFLLGLDARVNGRDGLRVQNSLDCGFYSVCSQTNTGIGIHIMSNATGHNIFNPYTEASTGGQIVLDSGSKENYIWGYRTLATDEITDNGTSNFILGRDSKTTFPIIKSPLAIKELAISNAAISGYWDLQQDGVSRNAMFVLNGTSGDGYVIFKHGSTGNVIVNPFQLLIGSTGGTIIKRHLSYTSTLTFPSIPANSTTELTIGATYAAVGDSVVATPNSSIGSGLVWSTYVSSANTITVRVANVTTGAITPTAVSWRADIWQH